MRQLAPLPPPVAEAPAVAPASQSTPQSQEQLTQAGPPAFAVPALARGLSAVESFYERLESLRNGTSDRPVRVLWMGDSHTAADFMTHQVRQRLRAVAPDGGAGFVRLGLDSYRHDAAVVERSGKWRKEPILPAQRTRVLDGVFGFGGIRTIPLPGGEARVSLGSADATQRIRFTLSYRLPKGSSLAVRFGGREQQLKWSDAVNPEPVTPHVTVESDGAAAGATGPGRAAAGARPLPAEAAALGVPLTPGGAEPARSGASQPLPGPASLAFGKVDSESSVVVQVVPVDDGIREWVVVGQGTDVLSVAHVSGKPEIYGVFVETETPGVVLDTVGINGARAATPLAWDAPQFEGQVSRHVPDLLVLAFGTNEAFDKTAVERYPEQLVELVARVRHGAPGVPCWVVAPPDASDGQGGSRARVAAIAVQQELAAAAAGCAYSSSQVLMGGTGSFYRWQHAHPPLARSDGIHLTVQGYQELGARLAEVLLPSTTPAAP